MDFFIAFTLIVLGLVAFDLAAIAFGQDSRESLGDDTYRPTYS